ncbi:NADP-dependent oxidoreductase [Vitiosangium sp. GDMCC 1.1324]|uniref:NADP-dependent oxidoreductase n=1 Tax=Vitiosangium sp. (strain GDMCC 1.1324) TaxID=2138576 RepID=UPI000D3D2395|nr:NADP-dependent oxidoreductase [Vitiosangium sp. GDMCC 1.1324]PTL79989.1 NADPH:quinone reductase [Vitiosangium sp. GDMCC 1.1324]
MSKAVQFDEYGDVNVLHLVEMPMPTAAPGRVVVEVRAAGINLIEAAIRTGAVKEIFPAHFPSGEGSDLAGVVVSIGPGVTDFRPGEEVLGWSDERSSHATHVSVPAKQLTPKPPGLSWEVAGSLYVAGLAAWGSVEAVNAQLGETVVVSGAAGGVGSIAVQLLLLRGARVLGIVSERNAEWLRQLGAIPVSHDERTLEHLRAAAPKGVDAWVDVFGAGYVKMAIALGVKPERINTIVNYQAAKEVGAMTRGTQSVSSATTLGKLAALVAEGKIQIPIAARYPLEQVRDAYRELEQRHTRGKIVLVN